MKERHEVSPTEKEASIVLPIHPDRVGDVGGSVSGHPHHLFVVAVVAADRTTAQLGPPPPIPAASIANQKLHTEKNVRTENKLTVQNDEYVKQRNRLFGCLLGTHSQ